MLTIISLRLSLFIVLDPYFYNNLWQILSHVLQCKKVHLNSKITCLFMSNDILDNMNCFGYFCTWNYKKKNPMYCLFCIQALCILYFINNLLLHHMPIFHLFFSSHLNFEFVIPKSKYLNWLICLFFIPLWIFLM